MTEFKKVYPSILEQSDIMVSDIEEILTNSRVEIDTIRIILLAVSEAFNNALLHANQEDPNKSIWLNLVVTQSDVLVEITDEGKNGLEKINHKKSPTLTSENGRGVDLIRHFARAVEFETTERGGLKVSMTFVRNKEKQLNNL